MQLNLVSEMLFATAAITGAVSLFAWRRRRVTGAPVLALLLAGATLSAAATGLQYTSQDLATQVNLARVAYLGNTLTGVAIPLFTLGYAGEERWLSGWRLGLLLAIPAASLLIYLTNDWHHAYYIQVWLDAGGLAPHLNKNNGPLYWTYFVWLYAYTLASLYVLARTARRAPKPYRDQVMLMALGVLAPAAGILAYHLGARLFGFLNPAVFGYAIMGLMFAASLFRYQLLDLTPVAYNLVFQRIRIGVIVVDAGGRVVDINPAAQADLGIAPKGAIGQPLDAALTNWPELLGYLRRNPASTADEDVPHTCEGRTRMYVVETAPLIRSLRQPSGQVILLRDATARRQNEIEQLKQQRALAALEEREALARELHDGAGQVMGYVTVQSQAARQYLSNGQTAEADATLARLTEVAQDAHADIRDFILGVQQGDAGRPGFLPAIERYVRQFSDHYDLPVELSLPDGAEGDAESEATWMRPAVEAQLLRIIQEALNNARKHAGATTAQVTFTLTPECVQVIVADDGRGFDPRGTFADPAQDGTQDDDGAGGFGLRIMRERAAEVGGSLEIRSAPGKGCKVIVQVPRLRPHAPTNLGHLRVMLADDQPLFCDGLRNLLAARGVQVIGIAHDGTQAVAKAAELKPDVVFMDVHMPGLDGIQAMRQIKASQPAVQVVMLTVSEDEQTLLEAIRSGASGYLIKNLSASQFYSLLEGLARGESMISPPLAARVLQDYAAGKTAAGDASPQLTERQLQVLRLVARGLAYKEIARQLCLSEAAVKYHVARVFETLHVNTRGEAVAVAEHKGWLSVT